MTLLDAIDEHRAAFEYDWRARFHLPLTSVPADMGWGEAYRLMELLARDPSSQVAAAFAEWDYPFSREAMAVTDLYDLQANAHFEKTKPYPRPWSQKKRSTKPTVTQDEVMAALRKAGHTVPWPMKEAS